MGKPIKCKYCNGTGKEENKDCHYCKGNGELSWLEGINWFDPKKFVKELLR